MRLVRLRLVNYRGIQEAVVEFRRDGITVVTGPNEAGKSSLAEAVRILFDCLDSANTKEVRSLRPVHRDEGPEIELEAVTGPYTFKYTKRFYKKPQTTLTITLPRTENLTGREAHERAKAILKETIDVELWRSLLVTQGRGFEQADLSNQAALSAALDRAAGGLVADPGGESLFNRVRQEVEKYFTDNGVERKVILDVRGELASAEAAIARHQKELAELERDIGEAARLGNRIQGLERSVAELQDGAKEYEEALVAIEAASTQVEKSRLRHESAGKSALAAERDLSDREVLIRTAAEAKGALERAAAACGEREPELKIVERGVAEAMAALEGAAVKRKEVEALAGLRRNDLDHLRGLIDLATLRERKGRIEKARAEAAAGREVLDRNIVDDARLQEVVDAEKAVLAARARLDAGAPILRIIAHESVELEADGKQRSLESGSQEEIAVPERARVSVPGTVEVEVSAGSSLSSLHRRLEKALLSMEEALSNAGVRSVEEAHLSHRQRQEAERTVERLREVEKDDLRDLTFEQLERKVAGLSKHLPDYPGSRPKGAPALPKDFESARLEDSQARRALEDAVPAVEEARKAFDRARDRKDALRQVLGDLAAIRRSAEDAHRRASSALDEARARTPDADLEEALKKDREATTGAAKDLTAAREALEAMQPEKTRALAAASAASLKSAERRLQESKEEAAKVRRRLDSQGESGLYEKLEVAVRRRGEASSLLDGLLRASGGAQLLFETMRDRRNAVRAAYMAPLRDSIESLGKVLFDDSFRVDVGEDLQVRSITRRSITIPFENLSTGTKEQISLIVRIACAMILSEEGGPLLLDDVLGFSDPERLIAMGAVLRLGGEKCQIVLLTSVPDRYSMVGDALVVEMRSAPAM